MLQENLFQKLLPMTASAMRTATDHVVPDEIRALDLYGVQDTVTTEVLNLSPTSVSLWRHSRKNIPRKHKATLLQLLHCANDAALASLGSAVLKPDKTPAEIEAIEIYRQRVLTAGQILQRLEQNNDNAA